MLGKYAHISEDFRGKCDVLPAYKKSRRKGRDRKGRNITFRLNRTVKDGRKMAKKKKRGCNNRARKKIISMYIFCKVPKRVPITLYPSQTNLPVQNKNKPAGMSTSFKLKPLLVLLPTYL